MDEHGPGTWRICSRKAGKGNAKDSANLPGMGGVYNVVNFNLYHYSANNPIRYFDPNGKWPFDGNTVLKEVFEACEEYGAEAGWEELAAAGSVSIGTKILCAGGIVLFCLTLQGDSCTPALPNGYYFKHGNIIAPDGTIIMSANQAWLKSEGNPNWTNVDTERWGKGTFESSYECLAYHYNKHAKQVGAKNITQYMNKAEDMRKKVMARKLTRVGFVDGETPNVTRYKNKSADGNGYTRYIDLDTNGNIISFGTNGPVDWIEKTGEAE